MYYLVSESSVQLWFSHDVAHITILFHTMGIHGLTVIPFILSGHSFYNSLNIQLFTFYHNSKHFRVCDQDNRTLAILRRLFWKLEIIKRLWI